MIEKLENLLELGGTKKDIAMICISAAALSMSVFDFISLPFDWAWIAIVLCGVPIILEAIIGLVTEFDIKADVLVSLALIASVFIGEHFAAGEVAFIMQIGALLEDLTVARARAGIEKLVHLTPQTARVMNGGEGHIVPAEKMQIGDLLRVLPGESIPVDGVITAGETSINQAVMTGESLPVDKTVGDEVSSGTVNQFGAFEMKATKVGQFDSAYDTAGSVIGNATKHGFLVRKGDALERLAEVKIIAFDKTGTLTYGKPQVTAVKSVNPDYKEEMVYTYAASAEQFSEHPLGKAVVHCFKQMKEDAILPAEQFQMLPGRGVSALIEKKKILAGNKEMMLENSIEISDEVYVGVESYICKGSTVIYIAAEKCLAGYLVLSDTIREESSQMAAAIKKLSICPVLLTGDHENAADTIAKKIGIEEVHANCMPEDKLKWIEFYQNKNEPVCMIGDGVNDAPSLKLSNVGIAMGGVGSDIAVEAADIALVDDEIKELPHLLALSKRMMTTIKCNLGFSMGLNFLAIILAISGILNPVVGALMHNMGSVIVIVNSALLLKWRSCFL